MASKSETGHPINVANFQTLISFVDGYGPKYNPAKETIILPALNTVQQNAVAALAAVNDAISASTNAINARQIVFLPISKFITRVVAAVAAADTTAQLRADVKTIARKLKGTRAKPKKEDAPDDPDTPADETSASHSASQMSFDNRIENMDKLIKLLAATPAYTPNETEFTIISLKALLTGMRTANTAVINARIPLSNARISRNEIVYNPKTGLVDIANDVKTYVKSVYGSKSPQYKQLLKLKFTTFKP